MGGNYGTEILIEDLTSQLEAVEKNMYGESIAETINGKSLVDGATQVSEQGI